MKLSDLGTTEKGIIVKVTGRGAFRKRIIEMGFIKGKTVEVILNAPLNDPIKYRIMGYEVSLRRSEANLVEVISEDSLERELNGNPPQTVDSKQLREIAEERSKTINVALVGNPNSGKTSLFNIASGAHERVGNYSGVTVDAREGKFKHKGYTFKLYDLPGTYSLSAYSPEELYVRQQINNGNPDVIINVVAASNLERNLYLTTQLIDMDSKLVIALNMYDELEKSGARFDHDSLARMIGMPIIPTIGKTGKGIPELFDKIIEVYEGTCEISRHIHINYGDELESGISRIKQILKEEDETIGSDRSKRYISQKLLEGDREIEAEAQKLPCRDKLFEVRDAQVKSLSKELKEDLETAFTNARYGFIDGALKQTYVDGPADILKTTRMIDALVTHKIWGYPIFFLFMFLMFEFTFLLGDYPMQWIEWAVGQFSTFIGNNLSEGPFKDLLISGIIGGVGSVIVFLPNIVILYMFISFMEDSGYMARAAFIMDKFMQKMGLHGKSFIPLVMGFGCNVPAIMSARTIESRNVRLLTILVNPLMSCSARLPVYLLFASAFFGKHGGIALFGLYVTGILLAILMSGIFKKNLIKGEDLPFVMELPPYRTPTPKAIFRHMWDKSSQYLQKMGGIILIASIIIWFLEYFPQNEEQNAKYDSQIAAIEQQYQSQPNKKEEMQGLISEVERIKRTEHQKNSCIGQIGRLAEPLVRPLGFDWKISVSLLSGMAAKEIVVSTLAVLYVADEDKPDALKDRLVKEKRETGDPAFTPLITISFLLFVLIYFPCIATVAAIKNEAGSWKWAAFAVSYTTALAWIVSFLVYQTGTFFLCGN